MKRLLVAALDFGVRRPLRHLAQRRIDGVRAEMVKHGRAHLECDFDRTCPSWAALVQLLDDAFDQLVKVSR